MSLHVSRDRPIYHRQGNEKKDRHLYCETLGLGTLPLWWRSHRTLKLSIFIIYSWTGRWGYCMQLSKRQDYRNQINKEVRLLCTADQGTSLANLFRSNPCREAVFRLQTFRGRNHSWHFMHTFSSLPFIWGSPRKALTLPWIWVIGVLDPWHGHGHVSNKTLLVPYTCSEWVIMVIAPGKESEYLSWIYSQLPLWPLENRFYLVSQHFPRAFRVWECQGGFSQTLQGARFALMFYGPVPRDQKNMKELRPQFHTTI